MTDSRILLSIIELGGYPDFSALYRSCGYEVISALSVRKALSLLKRHRPAVVVAEFNFQSDFRDRTSTLETLMAVVQRWPETRVIIFYEQEFAHQLQRLLDRHPVFEAMAYPILPDRLEHALQRVRQTSPDA